MKMAQEITDSKKLAKINTVKAKKDFISKEFYLSGKVEIDETKEQKITARFPGRIEKMYINFTGVPIRKRDHLYQIYSPEIYSVQESLLQSIKNLETAKQSGNAILLKAAKTSLNAARERLKLYDFTESQIKSLEKNKRPQKRITFYSPYNGIVITKNVKEGDYVKEGSVIYNISDLRTVWVSFDIYEKDIQWLKYGQKIKINFESYPGKDFISRISYIDPILNEKSRTVKARADLKNKNQALKPGMFATGQINSTLTSEGLFIDEALANKYICPMHPEIVKSSPSRCNVCNMSLVPASKLGYISASRAKSKKIIIPSTAPLITGKRAIVYVEHETEGEYIYEAREVVLGPRAGNFYTVEKGLKEGEQVVIEGVFKIDSAMQIIAKSSMMNWKGDKKEREVGKSEKSKKKIKKVHLNNVNDIISGYLEGANGLAEDNLKKAKKGLKKYKEKLNKIKLKPLKSLASTIIRDIEKSLKIKKIKEFRKKFKPISENSINLFSKVHNIPEDVNLFFCPMAEGGSLWFNTGKDVRNPYYGESMLRCGDNKGKLKNFKK